MLCCIMLSKRGELLEAAERWFKKDMSKYFYWNILFILRKNTGNNEIGLTVVNLYNLSVPVNIQFIEIRLPIILSL